MALLSDLRKKYDSAKRYLSNDVGLNRHALSLDTSKNTAKQVFSREGLGSVRGVQAAAQGVYRGGVEPLAALTARTLLVGDMDRKYKDRVLGAISKPGTVGQQNFTQTQKNINQGFTFAGAVAPYGAAENLLTKGATKIAPKIVNSPVSRFATRRAADVASGQILANPEGLTAKDRLKQAWMDVIGGTAFDGASWIAPKIVKGGKSILREAGDQVNSDALIHARNTYKAPLSPTVTAVENGIKVTRAINPEAAPGKTATRKQFMEVITGRLDPEAIKVSPYDIKDRVDFNYDPTTRKVTSWDAQDEKFVKRILESRVVRNYEYEQARSKRASANPELTETELQAAMTDPGVQFRVKKPAQNAPQWQVTQADDITTIRNQIREGGKVKELPNIKKGVQDLETALYDRFAPIKRLEQGKNLKPSETPTTLIKRATGSDGIANAKIEFELSPLLKPVKDDISNLDTLMVAERMTELSAQGRSANPGKALAQLQAELGPERFAKLQATAEQLRAYQDKYLQEWKAVGGLSEEGYQAIKQANQKYTPFQRVMDDLEDVGFINSKSLNSSTSPIIKLKGSERAIESPLESIVQNSYRMQKAIEKNRAMTALVNLGESAGITKAKGKTTGTSTLNVFENGKKMTYEVPKDVADAMKGIDEEQLNLVVKIMSVPARVLRAGATQFNAGFAVPNVIRDQLTAAVNSKYGGVPIYDFISGLASVVKKDEAYQKWLLSGADMATFAAQDRGVVRKSLTEAVNNKRNIGKFVRHPLELARSIGEYSEKGSRVGVFKRAERGAMKEGLTGFDVQLAAGREAREATVDFAQRGSKMKAANSLIPFLNARIQGTGKLLQSAKTRPIETGLIGTSIATIPAATLYLYNTSDPERAAIYDEIPDYITENNFILVTGNKETPFIKVPKGEIGRIFGNPTENFFGYMRQTDQKGFAEMARDLGVSLSPIQGLGDVMPTALSVPLQMQSNYDTFRGQNIVSPYQKDLPPQLQFNKNTSETAKWLGNATGTSPAKVEFGIKGFGAGVASQGLQASDALLFGKMPETNALPVIDRFAGEPKDLSKTATKIYEAEDKRKQEAAAKNYQAKELIKKGITTGNSDFFTQASELNPESFKEFYTSVSKELSKTDMSPTEKAINSLPKAQQAAVREQLEREGKVTMPDTGSYKAEVGSGNKASAAGSSGTKSRAVTEAEKARARIDVTYGGKDRVQVGNLLYVKDDTVEAGYKQYNLDTIKEKAQAQKLTNDIEIAKRTKDYKTWYSLKQQEYQGLEAKIKEADKVLDADQILAWQNKQADIVAEVSKYQAKGGSFTSAKKAKKASVTMVKVPRANLKTIGMPKIAPPKAAKPPKLTKAKVRKVKQFKVSKPKAVR